MQIDRFVIQKAALAFSLMIVINLFVYVGVINTFYDEPEFEDFCSKETEKIFEDKNSCEAVGGKWQTSFQNENNLRFGGPVPKPLIDSEFKPYCDPTATCREELADATDLYNRNIFIVSVVVGTIVTVLGMFFIDISAISSGLLLSGILLYFIGTVRFWSDMDEYIRLIVLSIVLVALFYVGFKKLNDKKAIRKDE